MESKSVKKPSLSAEEISKILLEINAEHAFPRAKGRGRKNARNVNPSKVSK